MASEAFQIFLTYIPYRPTHGIAMSSMNHSFFILYGQKDREKMIQIEYKLAEISPALNVQPAPAISDLKKKSGCFCIKVNNAWLRAKLEPFTATSVLISVFCVDIGLKQQVLLLFY